MRDITTYPRMNEILMLISQKRNGDIPWLPKSIIKARSPV